MDTEYHRAQASPERFCGLFLDPTNHTHDEFQKAFGPETADSVFRSLYRTSRDDRHYRQIVPEKILCDRDAKKYAFRLRDDRIIETVCIRRRTGTTICLSTQVGCAVRCRFCRSGRQGLIRNLRASEIVQQLLFADEGVNRIVFMGVGEPLHNYDEVIRSIRILRDRKGLNFPTDGISISTVGPVGPLASLREEHLKIQLVLSLHATDQATRDYLVPGMAGYAINEVVSMAMDYGRRHGRTIEIAYLVLPGVNDRTEDLDRLIRWFSGKDVVVNLMRYNGEPSADFKAAPRKSLEGFRSRLESNEVRATIRKSMGNSIEAACGQLAIR